jgi:uncharacterized protein (TIGR00369 family)
MYVERYPPSGTMTARRKMLDEIAAGTYPTPAFAEHLSLQVVALEWRAGFASVSLNIPADLCIEENMIFGGHVSSIHDQAAGFAMCSILADDRVFVTTELNVRYLAATRPGSVNAVAEVTAMKRRSTEVRVQLLQAGSMTSESVVTEGIMSLKA